MLGANERGELIFAVIGAALLLAATFLALMLSRKKKKARSFVITMLVMGAIPYLRFMVLSNHSYLHDFFTYRAQAVTLLALIAAIAAAIPKEKEEKPKKNSKPKK